MTRCNTSTYSLNIRCCLCWCARVESANHQPRKLAKNAAFSVVSPIHPKEKPSRQGAAKAPLRLHKTDVPCTGAQRHLVQISGRLRVRKVALSAPTIHNTALLPAKRAGKPCAFPPALTRSKSNGAPTTAARKHENAATTGSRKTAGHGEQRNAAT